MNKKTIKILIIIVCLIITTFCSIKIYQYIRVKNATINIELNDDLTLEFNTQKKVSDYIKSINGTIINDYIINSNKLGKKTVNFEYINEQNIKLKYSYDITVVDTTPPIAWIGSYYSYPVNSEFNLEKKILCGDNEDNKPKCTIEGEYDMSKVGKYQLTFSSTDRSGNKTTKDFTLSVYEPTPINSKSTDNKKEDTHIEFKDIVEKYKTDDTSIGLDISEWQGSVDFKKLKEENVEFVILRVGGTKGRNGEYFLDSEFENNIKNAKENNIKVGLYFYSYASTTKEAKENALWVIKQIKKYDIDLPIAFDWEEWSNFNEYNLSFFGLTSLAETFIDTVEKHGYKGMLYSSKTYLENIWLNNDKTIWLAHYTDATNYQGNYKIWQMTNIGHVNGIEGNVDVDILYKKH